MKRSCFSRYVHHMLFDYNLRSNINVFLPRSDDYNYYFNVLFTKNNVSQNYLILFLSFIPSYSKNLHFVMQNLQNFHNLLLKIFTATMNY